MQADTTKLTKEELVARFERVTDGFPNLLVPNAQNAERRLIVTFATHNNGARYASVHAIHRRMTADILAFRDPSNSYYLHEDGGVRFGAMLRALVAGYQPSRILFFGSSMAGYAALHWALQLGASCVVSNPQVNLDATAPLAWPTLRNNILRIPHRLNLDELPPGPPRAVLTVLHSRHPMDLENMCHLFALWLSRPGLALNLEQSDETEHAYLIRDFPHFRRLLEATFMQRLQMEAAKPAPA